MKFSRPRIRTVLILINLFILLLPLASISLLRLYENTLIRKTESSLIAQSAFIAAIYKSRITANKSLTPLPNNYGLIVKAGLSNNGVNSSALEHRNSLVRRVTHANQNTPMRWKPRYAKLNLSTNKILPRPRDATTVKELALAIEIKSGLETAVIMRDAQTYTLSGMRISNASGIVVASTSADTGKSILHWPEVRQSLRGLYVSSLRKRKSNSPVPSIASISRGAGIRVFISAPVIYNDRIIASLVLSRTPATLAQAIYNNQTALVLVMLGLIVIVILLSLFTSYTISRPLQAVARQAKMVAEGKSEINVLSSPRTIEVEELSKAVVTMSKALEERAVFIQDFASQVSHAFKTPLTAIQGAIELLKEHFETMTDDERSRFLSNLDSDSKYLESLVNRLLEFARADITKAITSEKANIYKVVKCLIARANSKNIIIHLMSDNTQLEASIDSTVLESILQNLIDNSVQHGKTPITINVNELSKNSDRFIQITFQDKGPGISESNAKSIFTPFFTTAREKGGTGLGLAVIKTLLKNYNSSIELTKSDQGACFTILLKQ